MPLKATEWDVYEFFSKGGKVRDVRLIMDRNSRRSKGVGSDEFSLKSASKLLMEVARKGEDSGYGVPCLLISAKNDLNLYPMAIKDSEMICQAVKINAPICISAKEKYMNNLFQKIVTTAQKCHLSIPETEHGRNKKRYRQLVNRSLVLASVGAAIAIVALAAYRAYACRKDKSTRQA